MAYPIATTAVVVAAVDVATATAVVRITAAPVAAMEEAAGVLT